MSAASVPSHPPASLDAVEEVPVWLEVNGHPAVTWMCTPEQLDELVVGWLHGEAYIDRLSDLQSLRPCARELGFWAQVPDERYQSVEQSDRRRVLASGCGAVTTILGSLGSLTRRTAPIPPLDLTATRSLFKEMFHRGERYKDTGGIHAAALTDGNTLLHHAEDIGRHNAVDKVIGAAVMAGRDLTQLILLVTGRISGELAFKAARAQLSIIATPSVPSTLAVEIARAGGVQLIGRAVSGQPQVHPV